MPTTTQKTIGTSADYSSTQAWEDACPANLVTNDEIWQGRVKNETVTGMLDVGGMTTDSTRYIELTTDTGASFLDNANVRTNALRPNASNGALITDSSAYGLTLDTQSGVHWRLSKLQITHTAANGSCLGSNVPPSSGIYDKCIFQSGGSGASTVARIYGASTKATNCLFICKSASPAYMLWLGDGGSLYNCTVVSMGGQATDLFSGNYGSPVVQNCVLMNCAAVKTGGNTPTYTTCLTDVASPPSGCTTTAYSTSSGIYFENITDGTHDFRIKTGSSAIDAGTTDTTNAANDISGLARPSGSGYDIGAWEFAAAYIPLPGAIAWLRA